MRVGRLLLVAGLAGLFGCASYQPGNDGRLARLPQNATANSEPQPSGSLPAGFGVR